MSNPFSKDTSHKITLIILGFCLLLAILYAYAYGPWQFKNPSLRKGRFYIQSSLKKTGQLLGLQAAGPKKTLQPDSNLPFEEGKQYDRVSAKIASDPIVQDFITKMDGKAQLIEFFSYACFGCWHIKPQMDEWIEKKKPEDLAFSRVPVVFQKNWEVLAKVYYVISELKRPDIGKEMFVAIQQKHINLSDEKLLKEFFEQHGVPEAKFLELYNSFNTSRSFTESKRISDIFQVVISPSYILNLPSGTYFLTTTRVGSEKGLFDLIEFLLAKDEMYLKETESKNN